MAFDADTRQTGTSTNLADELSDALSQFRERVNVGLSAGPDDRRTALHERIADGFALTHQELNRAHRELAGSASGEDRDAGPKNATFLAPRKGNRTDESPQRPDLEPATVGDVGVSSSRQSDVATSVAHNPPSTRDSLIMVQIVKASEWARTSLPKWMTWPVCGAVALVVALY